MKDLKTVQKAPVRTHTKEQIERMYKVSYYLDKSFLKPMDISDFNLDVYHLKECGEVRMKKPLSKIQPHAEALWARMTEPMRVMYLWSYLCAGLDSVRAILMDLEPLVKNVSVEVHALESVASQVSKKFPPWLHAKIKEGFGREWGA